ncbi:Zn-ribbon domain-containing OB-fold protein [Nocardia sp. NBC_01329]|uniref:Zn-ribbon domain-containing OB-fold protein n=1 Tax=Nocardia sp. NBC_01329 TaxID=2903594 RepID=UPI002E124E2D|nr:OB-fold domain-containing protein [Nocardia sp. NBC_01329]
MNPSDTDETGSTACDASPTVKDRLMIRRCARCDKLFAPLTVDCSSCACSSLEWVPSAGTGSIQSWRVVDRAVISGRGTTRPLTIAIVELDEGPWVYTSIEGRVPPTGSSPVRVRFQPRPRDDRFPVFSVNADPDETGSGADDQPEDEHVFT